MPRYFDFEVALAGVSPPIWRRFLIRTTSTFTQLHQAIQTSMGWEDRHLWEFRLPTADGVPIAGLPDHDFPNFGRPTPDARSVKLNSYFTGKGVMQWCEYRYDFGDDWTHDVKLMAVHASTESFKRCLIGGELAAPPEDCGGRHGYARMVHFLETGEDVYDDDALGLKEWLGDWKPSNFTLAATKAKFDR